MVAEDKGGQGLGGFDLALALEQAGRQLLMVPLNEAAARIARRLLGVGENDAARAELGADDSGLDDSVADAPRGLIPRPTDDRNAGGARRIEADLREVWKHLDRNTLFRHHWGGHKAKGAEYERIISEVFEPELAELTTRVTRSCVSVYRGHEPEIRLVAVWRWSVTRQRLVAYDRLDPSWSPEWSRELAERAWEAR